MALPIRDGNQTLTTLSTIIVNSAHVPAHSVVSLGTQAITDIATAVSGVELGPNTISALENIAVTFGVGASVTIGNVVSVTGGLTDAELRASSVTIGGSVQVSNFPATQAVTFTQAPVTFSNIAGSVTAVISGTPSVTFTQASVTFAQASVTFGQAVVSASNIGDLLSSVATDNTLDATTKFVKIGGHQSGSNQTSHIVHVSAGGSMSVDASGSSVTFTQASVTFNSITGSVSVLNFPATQTTTFSAITGSVSVLNLPATQTVTFTQASVTFGTPVVTGSVSVLNFPSTQTIAGTVTANAVIYNVEEGYDEAINQNVLAVHVKDLSGNVLGSSGNPLPISGTVTANGGNFASSTTGVPSHAIQLGFNETLYGYGFLAVNNDGNELPVRNSGAIEVGSLPAISGTVTVGSLPDGVSFGQQLAEGYDNYGGAPVQIVSSSITQSISGTVTANVVGWDGGNAEPFRIGGYSVGSGDTTRLALEVTGIDGNPLPISGTVTLGSSVTIGSLPAISGTVTANGGDGTFLVGGLRGGNKTAFPMDAGTGYLQTKVESMPAISGTVSANATIAVVSQGCFGAVIQGYDTLTGISFGNCVPVKLFEDANGVVGNVSGTVTIGAVSTSVTVSQIQGTSVTTSNFTSTTASQTLVSANSARRGLTVFNEGAGNLHICAGATATTLAYQVRLSAGDYWECPAIQTSLTHSAQFASAGTARVVEIL